MTIEQRQCLLKYLGYYEGKVDGLYGPLTEAALQAFREESGNPQSDAELDEVLVGAVFHGFSKGHNEATSEAPAAPSTGFWSTIKHFRRAEFACKCGKCGGFPVEPSEELVQTLDVIRSAYGKPLYINSGIRCAAHNASVDGATQSRHLYGDAADIRIEGVAPLTLYKYADALLPDSGGIGLYSWGIHIDTRKDKARWQG